MFSNAGPGGEESLKRWYLEVHGPDALQNGTFTGLHLYEAVGPYDARFLALWEGRYRSLDEARIGIVPNATGLRDRGRVASDLLVLWSSLSFLTGATLVDHQEAVVTFSVIEGGVFEPTDASVYRYGDIEFCESSAMAAHSRRGWEECAREGIAPLGAYRNMFESPESWMSERLSVGEPWVSQWTPVGSLRVEDLQQ